jgi:hypothetical protein
MPTRANNSSGNCDILSYAYKITPNMPSSWLTSWFARGVGFCWILLMK